PPPRQARVVGALSPRLARASPNPWNGPHVARPGFAWPGICRERGDTYVGLARSSPTQSARRQGLPPRCAVSAALVQIPPSSPLVERRTSERALVRSAKRAWRARDQRKAATRAACSEMTRALSRSGVPAGSPLTVTNGLDQRGSRGQPPQLSL